MELQCSFSTRAVISTSRLSSHCDTSIRTTQLQLQLQGMISITKLTRLCSSYFLFSLFALFHPFVFKCLLEATISNKNIYIYIYIK